MKRYLITFSLLVVTALANGQDSPSAPVYLNWNDCVQMAAQNNPDLLSALAASESSRALYLKSYNGILPQVNLSNTYSDAKTSNLGETKAWNAQGTASLDLIDVGQWATISAASASMRQSKANLQVASTNALLNLYKAFTSLLYNQEAILVNTSIRDTWKTNAQMVNLRYQSGSESKGNDMNTQAQYLQSDMALQQSTRDLRVAQQQLNQAIGKDNFTLLIVTGTWNATPVPTPRPDFEQYIANHPQIIAQTAAVEQARANINVALSTILPTLSLSYTRGTAGATEFPQTPYWAFTGEINYPLLGDGLTSTYYATKSARRVFDKATQDLRSLRNQLRTNLESAWSSYASAQDQVKVQYAFLQAALQRKSESDIRYQSGLMTFDDWIIVIQGYVNFQQSYLSAQQNLILAEAQWRFATGEQL